MPFLILANALLLPRFVITLITSRDDAMNVWSLLALTLVPLLLGLALFELRPTLLIPALVVVALNLAFYFLEQRSDNVNGLRVISLLVTLGALSVAVAPWAGVSLRPDLNAAAGSLSTYTIVFGPLGRIKWPKALVTLAGFWLATSEANLLIRFFLEWLDLTPKKSKESPETDRDEYNAGRWIGVLERALIYFLVINGQFGAIGFVLAAKGLLRIRKLEEIPFAEYVLVGTLLSALLAILVAALVAALNA